MLLVTGITGHTGKYFLQELINNNYKEEIRCLVRKTSDTSLLKESGLNISLFYGDINNRQMINQAMEGVREVLHIFNIHNSITVFEEAIKRGVKRVILVHTTGIYSKHKEASYLYRTIEEKISKIASDNKSVSVVILRPTMIFGDISDKNISKFIKIIDNFRIVPVVNGGKSLIQPVNARDLGRAYYLVLISTSVKCGDYILSGEKPIKLVDVLKLISNGLSKKTLFVSVPMGFAIFVASIVKLFTFGYFDYVEKVLRLGENRSFSHEKASKDFLFFPNNFEEGLHSEIVQYIESKKRK